MKQQGNFILFNREEFAEWLMKQNVKRKITLVQNHHTWSPNYSHFNGKNHFERLEAMRTFHMKDRGFSEVAQNLTSFSDGTVAYSLGRSFDIAPAGILGANTTGICIEHLGNFDIGGDKMTDEHKKTILFLNAVLCKKFNLPINTESIVYHHWWSAKGDKVFNLKTGEKIAGISSSKSCPGSAFFNGNTVLDAQKHFIPLIQKELDSINNNPSKEPDKLVKPVINKERIYAQNGVLKFVQPKSDGKFDYSIPATDVRHIKFDKGTFELKLVWAKGAKVSDLVKQYGADYGFNFPFFWDGNPVSDTKIGDKIVANVSSGKTTAWNGLKFNNGQPYIGKVNIIESLDKDGFICKGTPLLVENGNIVWDKYVKQDQTASDIATTRCQRTFVGLDANGNFHVCASDGRTSTDRGLSLEESALYLKSKNCVIGLNGDGGGSTILADQTGGLNQKLNIGANERVVNHAVLVFLKKESEKPMDEMLEGTKDVKKNAWYANSIKYVMSKGLMSVDDKGNFNPDQPITRAQLAVILERIKA